MITSFYLKCLCFFFSFVSKATRNNEKKKKICSILEIMGSISLRKILFLRYCYHWCRVWQSQNYHIRHALVKKQNSSHSFVMCDDNERTRSTHWIIFIYFSPWCCGYSSNACSGDLKKKTWLTYWTVMQSKKKIIFYDFAYINHLAKLIVSNCICKTVLHDE